MLYSFAWAAGDAAKPLASAASNRYGRAPRSGSSSQAHYSFQLPQLAGRRALRDPDSPEEDTD